MRSVEVVVVDVLADHTFEMATTEDEHPVEALTTNGSDEPLCEGVGTRCSNGCADNPDALGAENLIEAGSEFRRLDP